MVLDIESPLANTFSRLIGGSAGGKDDTSTHGGTDIEKPEDMPDVSDADYQVRNWPELKEAVQEDHAKVYIADNIDITNKGPVAMGDGVVLYGDYCNPDKDGLIGNYLHHKDTEDRDYSRTVFVHRGGEPVKLYGVYALGPRPEYFDPDHTSDQFEGLICSFLHEYASSDAGTFKAVGCRFTGWTLAGLELGARSYATDAEVHRSTFDRCWMEHYGYGIEHYHGNLRVDRCFFDKCRHGVSGFGRPNETIDITNSVFGPGLWASHAADMHGLRQNVSNIDGLDVDNNIAGQYLRIKNSSFMGTKDVAGYGQEGVGLNGESDDESQVTYCDFWHDEAPDAPGEHGSAIRQQVNSNEWENLKLEHNQYGDPLSDPDIGAPQYDPDFGDDPDEDGDESEKPSEDEDEQEQGDPSTPETTTLRVSGQSYETAHYLFVVNGDVQPTDSVDSSDLIQYNDGSTVITGRIVNGSGIDEYELVGDATITSGWCQSKMGVSLGNEPLLLLDDAYVKTIQS